MKLEQARFHFIGIGGIGMCGLAELLAGLGARVSGSDLSSNANTERLLSLGVVVHRGHRAENVEGADVVVYSTAVPLENPEMVEARRRKIPLIQRAEALAEIMRLRRGLAVAGTHGKTTTTSMVASILLEAGLNPTIFVGGRFDRIKSTALLGQGEWLVAEADESDGSFLRLSPEVAIITNIDRDHLDHFKTFENLERSFLDFALRLPFYGLLVVWGDDPQVRRLFASYPKRIVFYGFEKNNDWVVSGTRGEYDVSENGRPLTHLSLSLPGRHNALNAVAALVASRAAGASLEAGVAALARFGGVDRRFHRKGEKGGVAVYDDYGHHPTEVRAVLQAFKEKYPDRRLVVYFQPHRYTRTQSCWNEFLTCFDQADQVLVGDVYAAGETPLQGIDSASLARAIRHREVEHFPVDEQAPERIRRRLRAGDVFLTLGAGDGWKLGLNVLERL